MSARFVLAWLHRYLGLVLLLFLLLAGLTGAVLVFKDNLDAALNRDLFVATSTGTPLPAAQLADMVQQSHPELRVGMTMLAVAPGRTVAMSVSPRPGGKPLGYDQIFVDPHNGKIVGTRSVRPGWDRRHLMEGMLEFHGNLLMGTFGRWLMGIVAIGWVLSNLVGLYLTFPTLPPFWKRWALNWRINRGTRLLRFSLDLHRAGGLWLFLGLMVLAITSVEINFYSELFVPAADAVWKPAPTPFDPGARRVPPDHPVTLTYGGALRIAAQRAAQEHPGWQPVFANHFPALGLYGVSFIEADTDIYSGLGPAAYYVDDRSGKLTYTDDPYREGARGAVMRSLYPLHAGRIWGWPTKLLVFVLGLFTVALCVTGGYLWWRKRKRPAGR